VRAASAPSPIDVEGIVWRHGWNSMAVQTLDPGFAYLAGEDACVAYVEVGRKAWVAAGAPIASEERLGELAEAFVTAARDAGRRCCFFGTEQRFVRQVEGRLDSLVVGEQPVWDPAQWVWLAHDVVAPAGSGSGAAFRRRGHLLSRAEPAPLERFLLAVGRQAAAYQQQRLA